MIDYNFPGTVCVGGPTWKTLGALTSEARAEERVAENVPAIMRGPNPETMVISCRHRSKRTKNVLGILDFI